MKALVYRGKGQVRLEDIPAPAIEEPTDAILKVTTGAICGSDLHTYHRDFAPTGLAMGHEMVGVIQEVGSAVRDFKVGDRVVLPFSNGCGDCWFCERDWPTQCTALATYGKDGLSGGQAEYARIPRVDANAVLVPDDIPDEDAIFLADVFPTGFFCAENGHVKEGDSVVVLGSGPVGLCAQISARLLGAGTVIAVDGVPSRLEVAKGLGGIPFNMTKEDVPARVLEVTGGRGADTVLEAVGGEGKAFQESFSLVRGGGTISMVGVPTKEEYPLPILQMFRKDLTLAVGVCPARRYIPKLIPLLKEKRVDFSSIVSHVIPLEQGVEAYRTFDRRDPGTLKILVRP